MWVHVCSGLMSRCVTLAHAHYLMKTDRGGEAHRYLADRP